MCNLYGFMPELLKAMDPKLNLTKWPKENWIRYLGLQTAWQSMDSITCYLLQPFVYCVLFSFLLASIFVSYLSVLYQQPLYFVIQYQINAAHSVHKNSSSNSWSADFLPIKGEQVPTHAYTTSNLAQVHRDRS